MSVAGTITSFATGTYTVTRTAAGTFAAGVHTPGATSSINIDAGIFPLTGRELQALPEGQHGAEVRQLFTETQLHSRTPTHAPDKVSFDSETWTVIRVEKWPSYYRALIAREPTP